jgi:hypothetical protein
MPKRQTVYLFGKYGELSKFTARYFLQRSAQGRHHFGLKRTILRGSLTA